MGKASSAKKVARAARAGGRASARQPRSLLFPGVLTLIVVLGMSLVVYARDNRRSDDLGGVPQLKDHIHAALGVNVCGEWLPDIPEFESPIGIHTHGDGVLHIHPFSQLGVGSNATLGRYLQDGKEAGLDLSISSSSLHYLGKTYSEGKTKCKGVTNPQMRVAYWPSVQSAEAKPDVTTGGFADLRLTNDGGGFTIYYGSSKDPIPKPQNAAQLAELGAADGGQTAPSEDGTTTPAPGEPSATTPTTAAGGESTTTAAP